MTRSRSSLFFTFVKVAAASYLSYLLARGCNHYLYSAADYEINSPAFFVTDSARVSVPVNKPLVNDYSVVDDYSVNDYDSCKVDLERIVDSEPFATNFFLGVLRE